MVASATFLADIAQNVAGDRFTVRAMVPPDADLHAYEPTPRDLADVAGADLFLVNGAGLEGALEDTVRAAAGDVDVVEASAGLQSRAPRPGEPAQKTADDGAEPETDPHFWLDPTLAQAYVATPSATRSARPTRRARRRTPPTPSGTSPSSRSSTRGSARRSRRSRPTSGCWW